LLPRRQTYSAPNSSNGYSRQRADVGARYPRYQRDLWTARRGGFYYYGKEKIVETEHENPVVTEFRRRRYDGLSFPITLARHGYAVIVIDMYYFGDPLFPPGGVVAAFRSLAQCYEAIGKPERFTTYTYDGPHKFPARAQQLMLDWFDRWV
ncbi:MAG: hypothetical protein ACRD3O_14915, partial [Terriglobia bacterium]